MLVVSSVSEVSLVDDDDDDDDDDDSKVDDFNHMVDVIGLAAEEALDDQENDDDKVVGC